MAEFRFEFEGKRYAADSASQQMAGDVVQLPEPDNRYLYIITGETCPPQAREIIVVEGPLTVPDPSGIGPDYKGNVWPAYLVGENDQ